MANKNYLSFVRDLASSEIDKIDSVKRVSGIVKSVVPDTNYGKAVVTIGNKDLTLLNKSGEVLEENDHVWVHYWHSLADGYIALRNGISNNLGGFRIESAAVLSEEQGDVYNVSDEVINIDTANKLKTYYGNPNSYFILNEATGMYCDPAIQGSYVGALGEMYYVTNAAAVELKSRVANMNKSLWSNSVKSYWTPQDAYFTHGTEYTYYVAISSLSNINGDWCYYLGVYCKEVPHWHMSSDTYFKDPSILSNSGLLFVCKAVGQGNATNVGTSGTTFVGYGGANAALALCCGSPTSGYIYDGNTSTTVRNGGLLYLGRFINTSFKDEGEYNYSVSLTQKREIISSLH